MANPISETKQLAEDGTTFCMTATNLQRERTGVHARVGLGLNGVEFKWSWMNVERDEDRIRLVNAAFKLMLADRADIATIYPAKFMAMDFDRFCAGLWAKHIAASVATPLTGATDIPQEFHLHPFIPQDSGIIIFAPPGRGKSYGAMLIGVSIDAGVQDLWKVTQTKVMFVNLERSKNSIARRLGSVNLALGLDPARTLLTMNARGRRLKDLVDPIRESVLLHQVGLIIVDSLSRVGYGDMNANDAANAAMDDLNSVCESWIILAHTPRDDETHVFGCHDNQTEVLTRYGWRLFSDWKGEAVLTLKETNTYSHFVYATPSAFHKYEYNGDMVVIDSPSMNAVTTPNHRFYIWDKQGKKRWVTADTFPAESRLPRARSVSMSHQRKTPIPGFPIVDLARLAGIVISEGSFAPGCIQIAQRTSNAQYIRDAIAALGVESQERTAQGTRPRDKERMSYFRLIHNTPLTQWMRRQCGVGAANKHLPKGWHLWPLEARKALFEALMWGDGWWATPRYGVYTTISQQLADEVQQLAMHLGMLSTVKPKKVKKNCQPSYSVEVWLDRQWRWLNKQRHVSQIHYEGPVYCFTMPTDFLITRRHGKTMVSGNSQMYDAAADVVIRLQSERRAKQLGIGFEVTKANDMGSVPMQAIGLEFDSFGLQSVKKATEKDFPLLFASRSVGLPTEVEDYLRENGVSSATDVANALRQERRKVVEILGTDNYSKLPKTGKEQLYGIRYPSYLSQEP